MPKKPQPEAVQTALRRLAPMGEIRARAMFGGYGLYCDDLMFALITWDRLYLKIDAETEADFTAAGSEPFTYTRGDGRAVVMSYRSVPETADSDPQRFLSFATLALDAARRSAHAKRRKP